MARGSLGSRSERALKPMSSGTKKKVQKPRQKRVRQSRQPEQPAGPPSQLPGANVKVNDTTRLRGLGLNWTQSEREEFQAKIPTVTLPKANTLCPPKDVWAVESRELYKRIVIHEATRKMNDSRTRRRVVHQVESQRWQRTIKAAESAVIIDSQTSRIIGVVHRNFVNDEEILSGLHEVAMQQVDTRRNIRRDDPGKMVQHSYTSGSRDSTSLTFARNMMMVTKTLEQLRLQNHLVVSAHTLIWNIAKQKLPPSIIADMERGMEGAPRSDWNQKGDPVSSNISIKAGNEDLEFSGLELGPPNGVCSSMYSRFIHSEVNSKGAPWVISLTTRRIGGPERGGSFCFADYGIKVENTTNTCIVHDASMFHGTTVHDIDPKAKEPTDIVHAGFSLYITNNHKATYEKWKNGEPGRSENVEGSEQQLQEAESSESEQNEEDASDIKFPPLGGRKRKFSIGREGQVTKRKRAED